MPRQARVPRNGIRKKKGPTREIGLGSDDQTTVQAILDTGSTAGGVGSEAVASLLLNVSGVSASGEWLACWCRCCCGDAPDSEICFSVDFPKKLDKLLLRNLGKMGNTNLTPES